MKPARLIITIQLLWLGSGTFYAQPGVDLGSDAPVGLPLAIDGAIAPEQIPDELAYRHFILAIALHRDASVTLHIRRNAILGRVGLSEEDFNAVSSAIDGVQEDVSAINAEIARLTDSELPRIELLRRDKTSILDSARDRILSLLSPEGARLFQDHIQDSVKRKIRIYGKVPNFD